MLFYGSQMGFRTETDYKFTTRKTPAHTQALARKSGVSSKLGFSVGNITFL